VPQLYFGMQSADYAASCGLLVPVFGKICSGSLQRAPIIEGLGVGDCDKLPRSIVQALKTAASVVVPGLSTDEE
jgi:hypothetical protein